MFSHFTIEWVYTSYSSCHRSLKSKPLDGATVKTIQLETPDYNFWKMNYIKAKINVLSKGGLFQKILKEQITTFHKKERKVFTWHHLEK